MKITHSIFIVFQDKAVPFSDLSEDEKRDVANYLRRVPLETIGTVSEVEPA